MQRFPLAFFILRHAVVECSFLSSSRRALRSDFTVDLPVMILVQVFFRNIRQRFFERHIAVEEKVRIGRMIILLIKIRESFKRQFRDVVGVAARFISVRSIGEKHLHRFLTQYIIRR